jgi:hypothetical protein
MAQKKKAQTVARSTSSAGSVGKKAASKAAALTKKPGRHDEKFKAVAQKPTASKTAAPKVAPKAIAPKAVSKAQAPTKGKKPLVKTAGTAAAVKPTGKPFAKPVLAAKVPVRRSLQAADAGQAAFAPLRPR